MLKSIKKRDISISALVQEVKDKLKNEDGHYILEASIIVPFVLALVIAIGSMCKAAELKEDIVYMGADEMRLALINSYIYGTDLNLASRLEERTKEERPDAKDLEISGFKSGFSIGGYTDLIGVCAEFGLKIVTPIPLQKDIKTKVSFLGRKFIGDKSEKSSFGYENMEKEESENVVYLFPQDGKRYHSKECTYVKPKKTVKPLTANLKKEYLPCDTCKSKKCKIGDSVYIFETYGKVYHKSDCKTIEKNIVEVDKEIATEKGYTPCSKCKGG